LWPPRRRLQQATQTLERDETIIGIIYTYYIESATATAPPPPLTGFRSRGGRHRRSPIYFYYHI